MKKTVLIIVSVIFFHCIAMAQKPQGYSLDKGMKIEVMSSVTQVITQTVEGQNYETSTEIVTSDQFEVMEVLDNGYKIKMTGMYRTLGMQAPGQKMEMDSRKEGDSNLAYRALTGKSFQFEMDNKGKLLSFEGLDDYYAAIKLELTGTVLEGSIETVIESISEATLTSGLDGQFYIYPNSNEATWNRTTKTVANNLPVTISSEFTWDSDNSILAAGEMLLEGTTTVQGMAMSTSMKGVQNTIFDLDRGTGLSTLIQTQQRLSGKMEMQGMSIPMELTTTTKVIFKW
jgi:hypothetical protein